MTYLRFLRTKTFYAVMKPSNYSLLVFFCILLATASSVANAQFTQSPGVRAVLAGTNMASGDQCNLTSECKAMFGDQATDCLNSQSDQSVCICGASRCDGASGPTPPPPAANNFPGLFDPSRDLFLAFYDNRPDADDIHSQAGVATMLQDSRFANIDFYSVLGAYGVQGGAFLNSSTVMNLCFGSSNWTNAHPKDGPNWTASLNRVLARAQAAFARGGDIWIMEAGQSDFSADLVRLLKSASPSLNTNSRVHIVQHSAYNEMVTNGADLSYVRSNTDYNKIPDGNGGNNGSPQFNNRDDSSWATAISLDGVGACWSEARSVADANNFSGNGHYENPTIEAGGFDFSDVVEATWIFGFNSLQNVAAFFSEFPKDEAPMPPDPPNSTDVIVPNVITPLLLDE